MDVAEITPTFFVGIDEHSLASKVNVYPNPADEYINVAVDGLDIESITLHNAMGQIIATRGGNLSITQLDLADLSPGTYFVAVKTTNGQAISKPLIVK